MKNVSLETWTEVMTSLTDQFIKETNKMECLKGAGCDTYNIISPVINKIIVTLLKSKHLNIDDLCFLSNKIERKRRYIK